MVKRLLTSTLTVALLVLTSACGNSSDPANVISMPSSSKDFEGDGYEVVVDDLAKAGFTNVEPKALEDLVTGWISKEGSVETIAVNGDSLFTTDDNFPKDAEIVVSYHSFKTDAGKPSESATSSDASPASPEPSATQAAVEESLTEANNGDLAALLENTDPSVKGQEFVEKYEGRTIEFDGNVAKMGNHGTYKTRYDILIFAGDYTDAPRGPSFQFNDVNIVSDLNLIGSNIPDTIGEGDNLHIVAKVAGYNTGGDLLLLDPISTEMR
jgi:hypothetical protein